MYLTPDNAHELLGRSLDASRRILGVYPYTVIQFPDGTYGAMDSIGVCTPVSNDRFNQVWFDIIDGEPQKGASDGKRTRQATKRVRHLRFTV